MNFPYSQKLRDLSRRYLEINMDTITVAEMSQGIRIIQAIMNSISSNEKQNDIYVLLRALTPHLYAARGFALPEIPRKHKFYANIQKSQEIFSQINEIVEE